MMMIIIMIIMTVIMMIILIMVITVMMISITVMLLMMMMMIMMMMVIMMMMKYARYPTQPTLLKIKTNFNTKKDIIELPLKVILNAQNIIHSILQSLPNLFLIICFENNPSAELKHNILHFSLN